MKACYVCGAACKWSLCKPCDRLKASRWRALHPDKLKAAHDRYEAKNREKRRLYQVKYRAEHGDKYRARISRWQASNKHRLCVYTQNRQARKRGGGALSKGLVEKLYQLQRGKCVCCRKPLGDDFHVDHKMPLALGGANEDGNIQLLRKLCNMQKHTQHPVEFMRSRGFLL